MQRVSTFLAIIIFTAVIVIFASALAFAAEPIAVIIDVSGEASIGREGERGTTALSLKSQVYTKDIVYTGANGNAKLLFNDDSVVTVSGDSELYLADFAYTAREKKFNARLAKGAMRVITGEITERNPEGFNISTPHVSAGIRGTILNLRVTESSTEIAVLNTDKSVVVNGQEIKENQRIVIGEGAAPQISPITAEEKSEILGESVAGGIADGNAALASASASNSASEELSKTLLQTQPTTGTIRGKISGDYIESSTHLAKVEGSFMVNFTLQDFYVLNAETSGTWTTLVSSTTTGNIGNGIWSASGGTGKGTRAPDSDCGTPSVCFEIDKWKTVSVKQDYLGNSYDLKNPDIKLNVAVTDTAVGSAVNNSLSYLGIGNTDSSCTSGTSGCFSAVGNTSSVGANIAGGDGNTDMSGVVSHD